MAASAPLRRAGGVLVALLALLPGACAQFDVRPSLSHNYELVELAPADLPADAAVWQTKLQLADASCDCRRSELAQTGEACVSSWRAALLPLKGKPPLEQAGAVHRLVDRSVPHVPDDPLSDNGDHWSPPLETLRRGGDCEDLALLKRESLQALGWPEERLAIVVGKSTGAGPSATHVVLLATLENGMQLLLDSAEPDVMAPRDNYRFRPAYALTRLHVYKIKPWRRRWWRN